MVLLGIQNQRRGPAGCFSPDGTFPPILCKPSQPAQKFLLSCVQAVVSPCMTDSAKAAFHSKWTSCPMRKGGRYVLSLQ
jgi:hypothetical protein